MLLGTAFPAGELCSTRSPSAASPSLASVIGTFFAWIGRGENAIINALYKSVIVARCCPRSGSSP